LHVSFPQDLFRSAPQCIPKADMTLMQPSTPKDTHKVRGGVGKDMPKIAAGVMYDIEPLAGRLGALLDRFRASGNRIVHMRLRLAGNGLNMGSGMMIDDPATVRPI
jgi:hypothetical protein